MVRAILWAILISLTGSEGTPLDVGENTHTAASENCNETASCCQANVILWNHVKRFTSNYYIRELLDSTPKMLERYYSFYNIYAHIMDGATEEDIQHAMADCFWGVMTVFLNALPAIEYERGLDTARNVFLDVKESLEQASHLAAGANWTIPTAPLYSSFPVILGLMKRKDRCFGLPLRIYVYDTGVYSAGALFCSAGQWGVEVLFHMYLMQSDCRTLNADEADLFIVPDYRVCHFQLAPSRDDDSVRLDKDSLHSQLIKDHKGKSRHSEQADDIFINLLEALPYFQARQGLDHVFMFSDQGFIVNFTHIFPSWRKYIPNSIFVTTEGFTPGCDGCFTPWKDLIIPGHLDLDRLNAMLAHNQPSWNRTLFFNFHGRTPLNHKYYSNVTVREDIERLAHLPNVSIGGFVANYFEIMGSSHFCLIPEGTSSWTNHLYEAFFAGCIPLILSDKFVLPFQDLIDWKAVSVKWPQSRVGVELYDYVVSFVTQRRGLLEKMKSRVDEMQCWFHFYRVDERDEHTDVRQSHCSPYYGLLHGLNKRRHVPQYLWPPYWG